MMIQPFLFLLAAAIAAPLHAQPPAPTDDQVKARESALTLAGAFSNDAFKLRDGYWTDSIAPGETKVIQVNLYAGNEYWFSVGATPSAKKLSVNVFDESGKPKAVNVYQNGSTSAAGFAPEASGPYYVQVKEIEGEPAIFCMIYSYK